jgi:hypothetical protein
MTYLFLVWIAVSIGFVIGAAWSGLSKKNREADQQINSEIEDFYPSVHKGGLR